MLLDLGVEEVSILDSAGIEFKSSSFSGIVMGIVKAVPSNIDRAMRIQGIDNSIFAVGRLSGSLSRHKAMKLFASLEMCRQTSAGIKT